MKMELNTSLKIGNRLIGNNQPVFVIAEAGSNHNGSLEQAFRLIDVAAAAGADAVKFQIFRAEYLYHPQVGTIDTPDGPLEFFDFLRQAAVSLEWLPQLRAHADRQGVIFLASAFDEALVDALDAAGVPAHKVASPELNHLPLIRHMAQKHKPLLVSVGLSSLGDIEDVLATVEQTGNRAVALLHCVSAYPTPPGECNLRIIPMLKQAFQIPVGFSDHTVDAVQAPQLAVALGANLLEKHFTLSRQLPGPDHPFALEPAELKQMVQVVHETEQLSEPARRRLLARPVSETYLGNPVKRVSPSEAALAACDRRSIMVIRAMSAGTQITPETVRILRAERNLTPGLAPKFWDTIIGRHVIRDVPDGRGLTWADLIQ